MSRDRSSVGASAHRVLIVGGDDAMRRLLRAALAAFGCESYQARDGPEAGEVLRGRLMCAVIVDLVGPGANCRPVLDVLRRPPDGRTRPTIAISADPGALAVAAESGVGAALLKPFQLQHLQAAIESLVVCEGSAHAPIPPFRLPPVFAARRSSGARRGGRSAIAS